MLSLSTPPGEKVRLRGAEGAAWRDVVGEIKIKTDYAEGYIQKYTISAEVAICS